MQIETVKSMLLNGIRVELWKINNDYFIAWLYNDGVCHLFISDDRGRRMSDNLLTHNMDSATTAREKIREYNRQVSNGINLRTCLHIFQRIP